MMTLQGSSQGFTRIVEAPHTATAKSDDMPTWTVRGVPLEMRSAANAAAKKDGMPVGAWLERVIRQAIQETRAEERRLPVPVLPPPSDSQTKLSDTQAVAAAMVALASAGVPITKRASNAMSRALIAHLPRP